MKVCTAVLACCLLFGLAIIPAQAFADEFCQSDPSIYQYQPCGTVADANLFPVNAVGTGDGIIGAFQGYHADFSETVHALVWRGGQLVYTGDPSPTNKQLSLYQEFTLVPTGILQTGDMIEFVLSVDDINGHQDYYSQQLNKNVDGLNHAWGTSMTAGECDPNLSGSCVFIGFEDLPKQEASDFDYNDFKFFAYGIDVPEPSSLALLGGVPLAFAMSKLRRWL